MSVKSSYRWLIFVVTSACILSVGVVFSQTMPGAPVDAGKELAQLTSAQLLGTALVMTLALTGYLAVFIARRLSVQLDRNIEVMQRACDAIYQVTDTNKDIRGALEFCRIKSQTRGQ